ncbi:lysophospholipid acyltransferase family protein [Luteibacter sp. PPL201]|jgi:1-acyl-sn-glycerol-3-phosphate acyltransferase|uniref:Lysophospholipid acyltransferase family protein n=1 Tax=Luteibacter sahnii TaxID=3021977 RepID=A0ABT6BB31_9GAMM|nr:lysophospholipid acyltransferase family protein [Luteibacter sp. PPL193]MDY1547291.1 lysophospholipid acyltransferase family protein [Luteibacter sp. PPL193]
MNRRGDAWAWRFVFTGLAFAFFGVGGLLLRAVILPVVMHWPAPPDVRRKRARRTVGRAFWLHSQFMYRTGLLTYRFDGLERLGRPGQLIVANHPSLIDVVFLLGHVPDANCVVKHSLWENPYMRGPVRVAQYISNDGSAEMLDRAADVLREGQTLIVFPEGTRTTPGQPPVFHRGAAAIALRGAQVVTPVFIRVEPTTLTKAEPWYRIPDRRVHVHLRVGGDIDVAAYRDAAPAPIASRRLNEHLHHLYAGDMQG